jgi:hypothetical protein
MWQRRHAPDIVAEVTPVEGMGTWEVCAWRAPNRRDIKVGASCCFLTDAMNAADALAGSGGHTCDASCEKWEAVERRQKRRAVEAVIGRITGPDRRRHS